MLLIINQELLNSYYHRIIRYLSPIINGYIPQVEIPPSYHPHLFRPTVELHLQLASSCPFDPLAALSQHSAASPAPSAWRHGKVPGAPTSHFNGKVRW